MKIRCSIGKGEMDHQECLACALRNTMPGCGFEHSFLNKLYQTMDQGRPGIHVSDLVHCLRRSYLDKTARVAEAPHQMLNKWFGIAVHDFLEQGNNGEGEMEIEFDGVVGRVDLYRDRILTDYKTTKKIYPDLLPYGEHARQLNMYGWMLKQLGHTVDRMLLVYISKFGPTECSRCKTPVELGMFGEMSCPKCGSTPRSSTFGVKTIEVMPETHAFMDDFFHGRKAILSKALEGGDAPDGAPSWECKYCEHVCPFRDGNLEE